MGAPLRTDIKIKCHLLFPIQRFKGTKEARLVAGCVCVCVCVCVWSDSLSQKFLWPSFPEEMASPSFPTDHWDEWSFWWAQGFGHYDRNQ